MQPLLTDNFGRTINYLRLSVTDRCNFRCLYCMAESMTFAPSSALLTFEELTHICRAFTQLGVRKIRITGGEPLVRRHIVHWFRQLHELEHLSELTLTTNGSLLAQHAAALVQAGVQRINVSLDTLDPQRFRQLSRTGELKPVLEGIDTALAKGLKIKLNSVILKHYNTQDILSLVEFALAKSVDLCFIEEMPLGEVSSHDRREQSMPSERIRTLIQQDYHLTPSGEATTKSQSTAGPARYWQVDNTSIRIGFISPHSDNFCASCNRVRLTATGQLLLCLGNDNAVDLRAVVRRYPHALEPICETIIHAVANKPERHHFDLHQQPQILRFMNATGG